MIGKSAVQLVRRIHIQKKNTHTKEEEEGQEGQEGAEEANLLPSQIFRLPSRLCEKESHCSAKSAACEREIRGQKQVAHIISSLWVICTFVGPTRYARRRKEYYLLRSNISKRSNWPAAATEKNNLPDRFQ